MLEEAAESYGRWKTDDRLKMQSVVEEQPLLEEMILSEEDGCVNESVGEMSGAWKGQQYLVKLGVGQVLEEFGDVAEAYKRWLKTPALSGDVRRFRS